MVRRWRLAALALLLALGLVLLALGYSGLGARWRAQGARQFVDTPGLNRWRVTRLLCEIGAIQPYHSGYRARTKAGADSGWRQRPDGDSLVGYRIPGSGPEDVAHAQADAVAQLSLARRVPVVSLQVHPRDLHGPTTGILTNWRKTGRDWERPAQFVLYERGTATVSTIAGIRVAGEWSRSQPKKSLRLVFDASYGAPRVSAGALFGEGGGEVSSVMLSSVRFRDHLGTRMIALDLMEQAGVPAPRRRPCLVMLNGKPYGIYCLVERIDQDLCATRFGHRDFGIAVWHDRGERKMRVGRKEELAELEEALEGLVDEPQAHLDAARGLMDVGQTAKWVAAANWLALYDAQPCLLRDRRAKGSRWFPVAWDLDYAFLGASWDTERPWELDMIRGERGTEPLIRATVANWPEFRKAFVEESRMLMAGALSQAKVTATIDTWEDRLLPLVDFEQTAWQMPSRATLRHRMEQYREFVRRRPAVVSRQLEELARE